MKNIIDIYKSEFKATIDLCIPIIVASLGSVLMGVSNNIMIGKMVGTSALAAAGVTNSIYVLFVAFGMGTMSAVAPMVATAVGARDRDESGVLFRTSVEVAFILTLFMTATLFVIAENFEHFIFTQNSASIINIAKNYLRILTVSLFPFMMFMAAKQFSDGMSYTKPAVYITIIGVIINILFNWILINGLLGLPKLGIVGSGIATLIARTTMAIMMFSYIISNSSLRKFIPKLSENINTFKSSIRVIKIGIPSGFQLFFEHGAFAAAAIIVLNIGEVEAAAHQIGITLAAIATMLSMGIGIAGSIRVGNAVGEQNIQKVRRAANTTVLLSALSMIITCSILLGFNNQLVLMFNKTDSSLFTVATSILVIAGFFQLSDGLQVVSLGILRGVSDVNIPTIFTLLAYWVIGLPLGYYLAFTQNLGVEGVWYGLLAGLSSSAILLLFRFYRITRVDNQHNIFLNKDSEDIS